MIDGEYIEYYESGEIRYKYNYLNGGLNGGLNGESIYYYTSGDISSKSYYKDGELHGESFFYNQSGDISHKYYYINDKFVTELEWISYNRSIKLELLGL